MVDTRVRTEIVTMALIAAGTVVVAFAVVAQLSTPRSGVDSPAPAEAARDVAAFADWSRLALCESETRPTPRDLTIALPGWRQLPSGPAEGEVVAEVGGALATWKGSRVAVFDAGTWRCPDRSPVSASDDATIVWTGTHLLVWGDGRTAVLDPTAGAWRLGAAPPEAVGLAAATVWTGRDLVVYGALNRSAPSGRALAYDPAADRWQPLPAAPRNLNVVTGVWTGREVVLIGAELDGNNQDEGGVTAIAFDPAAGAWRELPAPPLSPQASTVAWTGEVLVAWDYLLNAATLDLDGGAWKQLPEVPLRSRECSPSSAAVTGGVVGAYCDQAVYLDIATRTWTDLQLPAAAVTEATEWNGDAAMLLDLDGDAFGARELWRLDAPVAASRRAVTSLRLPSLNAFAEATLPPGWYAARETLTPTLSGPLEVLTVTTGPAARAGGSTCAHLPENAVEQLGPRGALITFQAGGSGDVRHLPSGGRPYGGVPTLPNDPEPFGFGDCFANADELDLHWLALADEGASDGHYVMVALGAEASARRRAEALAIVNSFRPLP